jgi:small-conductance mechanosensitive channel
MTKGRLGTVQEITTRTVVIDTADGRRIFAPNSDVLNDAIVNYSALGHRRASFELMVRCDEDLELALATAHTALSGIAEVHSEPPVEVQIARLVGRLAVIRALIWCDPDLSAERAALDAGIRAVLADLKSVGIEPDGPTALELFSSETGE